MVPFAQKYYKQLVLVVAAVFMSTMAMMTFSAQAAVSPVYDSTPSPLPNNLVSLGFQASTAAEVGAHVELASGGRNIDNAVVTMSSWACEEGGWSTGDCVTTPGATFEHPITLSIYNVDGDGNVTSTVDVVTQTFEIPFRPSPHPDCTTGGWSNDDGVTCSNGIAHNIVFDLDGVEVPDEFVYGVAFNTNTWGYAPLGESGSYDSLNVGLVDSTSGVSTGTLIDSYWASGSTPVLEAIGGWIYTPAVQFNADVPDTTAPIVSIDTPEDGDVVTGNVIVTGDVIDENLSHYNIALYPGDADVNDFSTRLDQSTVYGDDKLDETLWTFNSADYADGEYQIRLAARDLAGNRDLTDPETGGTTSVHVISVVFSNYADSKDECKNGGWMLGIFTDQDREFRNQGDCVSHFASEKQRTDNPDGQAVAPATTNARRR